MDQTSSAQTPKQQVVEAIKNGTNMLVTVSRDPSVDQLSACIGLTLMLNKLNKHATAVYSGDTPSTLQFLQPEKTIETNTDSLRDFIISLDRSKADKLRYKVEDDVVKIFITPYRTSLSGDDLRFSQGDFNVDVVLALGVDQRDHLDEAIMGHGRILHDAKVLGISFGQVPSEVGSVNWHEPSASSLSEMLVSISESFQSGILDAQMSTAFLTGIVAETDRFKNDKTTPKVMTMSAQLMAAGANQQLIATELALPEKEPEPEPQPEPETPELPEPQPEPEQAHIPIAERSTPEPEHIDLPQESPQEGDAPVTQEPPVVTPEPAVEETPEEQPQDTEPAPELPEVTEDPVATEEQSLQDHTSDNEDQSVSLHPESFEAPHDEIHIDEAGRFTDEETRKTRQKVIEPLTMGQPAGPKTNLSNYVFDKPDSADLPATNTAPEPVNPIMENVVNQPEDPSSPLFSTQNSDLSPDNPVDHNVAPDVEDVVGLPEPFSAPTDSEPPREDLPVPPTLDQLKIDEDAARNAVLSAVNSSPDSGSQSPLAALNAAPMPLDQPLIDPATGVPPPPAVPPPMVQDPSRTDVPLPGQG